LFSFIKHPWSLKREALKEENFKHFQRMPRTRAENTATAKNIANANMPTATAPNARVVS
jgi:hypothetical protein